MRRVHHERFPLIGYVLINGVVIVITLVAWYAAKTGLFIAPPVEAAGRPGVAALLVLVPVCFLLATVFDMAWRAIGRRRDLAREEAEASPPAPSSPAIKRDLNTKEVEKV